MQISVMQQSAFTRTAILAVLVVLATTQQCDYQVTNKSVINVPASEKNGAVFMSDVYKSSREECQRACCDMEEEELNDGSYVKCNLGVFHHGGNLGKANCFLIHCPSIGSCIFSELKGFSSSFVAYTLLPTEAFFDTTDYEEATQSSTVYSDDDVNSSTITSKTTSSPKSTPSIPPTVQEPASTIPSSVDDPSRKEMEDNQTLAGTPTSAALVGNETLVSNETMGVGVGNETSAAAQMDEDGDEDDVAANSLIASNGALIAAVCFGVLFLMAVLVVIGKHWYEAYQRRHYSKVDYLINGMYN